jgi:hypothetical protein
MSKKEVHGWNRYQWASGSHLEEGAAADRRRDVEAWSLTQVVGDRPGLVRQPVMIDIRADGLFHGLSGSGFSDTGGLRWASLTESNPESAAREESTDIQAARAA